MAWFMPVGEVIFLGERALKVDESMLVLGREFTIQDADRSFLAMLFFFHAVWVAGSWFARPDDVFIPFTFAMVALLVAALAVEPFLYAALLIEVGVLLAVPLLSPPGKEPGRGVFRFLSFQTFGMPFILFARIS